MPTSREGYVCDGVYGERGKRWGEGKEGCACGDSELITKAVLVRN